MLSPSITHKSILGLLFIFCLLLSPISSIRPTQPVVVNPNTQSSPSNFIFYFMLENKLPSTGYLMITFSTFTTSAIPITCNVLDSLTISVAKCLNLNTAGNQITITQTGVNSVNSNINGAKTVVVQFNTELNYTTQYKLQIRTTNVLPNIGSITKSIEMYTITNTGVMIQENWNFGQVFLQPKQNIDLGVLSRNSMVNNLPGKSFTNLLFQITVGVKTPTPMARLKFVIDGGFTWTDSSIVSAQSLVGPAPVILNSKVVSPNVIITTFNQSFPIGRKFTLTIPDYKNPLAISSGYVSVYHLPYNSMSPLQISQQNIPIQTVPFVPTLTLLTIDGTVPIKPVQFYTNTVQYIKLNIVIPRDVDPTFLIQISSDTLVILQGSVFAKTSTVESAVLNYDFYAPNGVRITGFPLIPESSLITVTMRVKIPVDPIFTIFVKVDTLTNINSPIISGSIVSNSAAIPELTINSLYGSQNQLNKLSIMNNVDSSIRFNVVPTFLTNAGSLLKIITSSNLYGNSSSFNSATSCTVSGNVEPCTIVSNDVFTNITIASNSSYNLFPNTTSIPVVINNLSFKKASSHSENIYHFYFSLVVSQAVNAAEKSSLIVPIVIPERNNLTGFSNYFSNNMNNTGTNFPNILRLVNTNPSEWTNIIQAWERRIISVFARQGWTNLFSLANGASYPGISNIDGFTFTYLKGTTTSLTEAQYYPIDWDRIDIILDGNQSTTSFSIALPTTFISNTALQFQIMVGVYDTVTRKISYLNIQPQPINGNPTYILPAGALLSAKPKVVTNKIQLAGFSGSYKNINITITPGSGTTYSGTSYVSSLIVVSDWNWFDQFSTFANTTLPSVSSINQQKSKSVYMPNNQKYLTYIPLKTSAAPFSTLFTIYMNNVKLPYTDDLPYYSIYLVDDTGTINCYNQFINQDKSVFYRSTLASLTFSCNVNTLGVTNTYCSLQFIPNNAIQIQSTFVVYFVGMLISTDSCSITMNNVTSIPTTCSSNIDKNQLSVKILNNQRLALGQSYRIVMGGVSILANTIIHYITGQLRDPTSSYVIQTGTRVLYTSVQEFNPIYISQVKYTKNNPIVYSSFSIKFSLPRQLNSDELFAIVMSKDLSNLNTIYSKLNVILYDSSNVVIPIVWSLNLKNYQIIFEGLQNYLSPTSYRIQIHGLRTPSTIEQDLISLIYLRKYDSTYTVYNNQQSTTIFPQLIDKVNSLIRMSPLFNTEGLEQQLLFTINNQYATVNQLTQWIINLPRYYSEYLWNEDYLIYCTISDVKIPCGRDSTTPYQIKIHNSPRIIEIGTTYTIRVFGLQCPRSYYLNGFAAYVTESIFLGISQTSVSSSYIQYSELFLTQSIVDTQSAGFGSIVVLGIESSNMEVLQSTFFTINATCTVQISTDQSIYLTFPAQFDLFHDLPLTVQVLQGATIRTYQSEVFNRRIGFTLTGMTLIVNTLFSIKISSLPTPSTPCTIDMNKLRIMSTSVDKLRVTAATLQLHNLVGSITFIPSDLHIVINRYNTISVTAGTFSLPVLIQPSDFVVFVSNMKISFVSDALGFSGAPAYMYLGDSSGKFSVGADQSLIPTIYAFDIIKTETSISAFYTSLSKYTVLVSNLPISISIPSSINVPLGGCSVPYEIVLTNSPYSDVQLSFQYDTSLYNLHLFWLNQQTTYNELSFTQTITRRWLSFCSDSRVGLRTLVVRAFLGGTNEKAYLLSNSQINVNIVSNSTTNISPVVSLLTRNLQKTYAGFEINSNLNGHFYYQLMITSSSQFMDIVSLKASTKEINLLLKSQNDYLSYIYQADRYHRVGMVKVQSGSSPLQFDDLLPGLSYTVCGYFINQHKVNSQQICSTFSTLPWGVVAKAILTFNQVIYEDQLNKALCFFVKASQSKIYQVTDLQGRSCSLNSVPENYNYKFKGQTISSQLSQTLIYFITNKNLTTDPSVTKFNSIYDSNGITTASLSFALSSFAVNYIQSSRLISSFYPPDMIAGSDSFKPEFSADNPIFDNTTNSITINNIFLNKPGSVYMILTFSRKISYNKITGHTDIDIRPPKTPTSDQLLNCLDGYSDSPLDCKRIILVGNNKLSATFTGLSANSLYVIYYSIANQYPLRPVIVSDVSNYTILTTSSQMWMSVYILYGLLLIAAFLMK